MVDHYPRRPERHSWSRRTLVTSTVAIGMLALVGCKSNRKQAESDRQSNPAAKVKAAAMTVYRDPNCGCCEAWAELARQAGYEVTLTDRPDMPALKASLGVPEALASCHTATIGDYVVEGHVPLGAVARLLSEKPKDLRGIAVPGMPRGSPGMETPDGSKDEFQVMAFDRAGNTRVFTA